MDDIFDFGEIRQIDTGGQYTDKWWLERRGRFGASDAHTIATAGAGLETLIRQKRFERNIPPEKYLEWQARQKRYISEQMDLGSSREIDNSAIFYEKTGLSIEPCDMVLVGDYINLSPDGDIKTAGGVIDVEEKNIDSANGWNKYELVEKFTNGIPDKYEEDKKTKEKIPVFGFKKLDDYYQMQMRLAFRPVVKCLYILSCDVIWGDNLKCYEIERDEEVIKQIKDGLKKGIGGLK